MSARPTILTVWEFASESSPGKAYQTILYVDGTTSCECPGYIFKRKRTQDNGRTCKHTRYVEMGTADVHARAKKDYGKGERQPVQKPTGRQFDFSE